jgi:hypothetical protein
VEMTAIGWRSAIVAMPMGDRLCISVEVVIVVQTVSYINYELRYEWSWTWDVVTSLVTSLVTWHGEINTRDSQRGGEMRAFSLLINARIKTCTHPSMIVEGYPRGMLSGLMSTIPYSVPLR